MSEHIGMPMPLEEIGTATLIAEMKRRRELLRAAACPYCGQPIAKHTCKYSAPANGGKDRTIIVYGG